MLNSNEPIKVAHLQKLAYQCWMAHWWQKWETTLLVKTRTILVVWESVERSNPSHSCYFFWLCSNPKNGDIGSEKCISIKFH